MVLQTLIHPKVKNSDDYAHTNKPEQCLFVFATWQDRPKSKYSHFSLSQRLTIAYE